MKASWTTIGLALMAVTAYCHAITWTDSFEFDSAGDYNSTTNTCYTELGTAAGPSDAGVTGSSANLVLPDGYLRILNAGGKKSWDLSGGPGLVAADGWTVEYRMRIDRSRDNTGAREWQLRLRDSGGARKYATVGGVNGTDIAGIESESPNFSKFSWEPASGGVLIEQTSDWHTYRIVHDPAKATGKTELWVDGTLVVEADVPASSGNQLKFGCQKGATTMEVWVDYIRWAKGTVERPSSGSLVIPALKNRLFDNVVPYNAGPPIVQGSPVFWQVQNMIGDAFVYPETGTWRCEPYGRALRLTQGAAYDVVVKQSVACAPNSTAAFKTDVHAYAYDCYQIQARVGIDPTGGTDPLSPSIVWCEWTNLYDDVNCMAFDCIELQASTATSTSDKVCVFIEAKAENSPGTEQSTFIDNAEFTVVSNCGTPPQDVDKDGDVDLQDFGMFQACFNGPNRPWPTIPNEAQCKCLDTDPAGGDGDVDLADFGMFQSCFNGPNRPPACL